MKAVRIHERGATDVMKFEEIETPVPGAGEVLIKVAVAGISYSDIGQRKGTYPNLVELPMTLGNEVAGTVVARGPGVVDPMVGTRIVSLVDGGYAEYAIARANQVMPILDGVSFAQATVIPIQGQTAYLLLDKAAQLRQGESILIHASSGGVGSLAVQLAQSKGASLIIGSTSSHEKLDFVRSLGVQAVINTNDDTWVEQVMQTTHGHGVNVVLDALGGSSSQQSIASLAPFGRMVVFGSLSDEPTMMVAQQLISKCLTLVGYNTLIQPLEDQMRAGQAIMRGIARDQLKVTVRHSFPLEKVAAAHQAIEDKQTYGKVVLTM
ncbi:MAG: zinc-binding dehydrogenase [Ktedonobacteraceae bacterium]|nr:zinc-binding dehydrogenase [Ktedonobacteraceae bacterium]